MIKNGFNLGKGSKKNYQKVVPGPLRGGEGFRGFPLYYFVYVYPLIWEGLHRKQREKKQISGPLLMGGGVTEEVGRGPLFGSFF